MQKADKPISFVVYGEPVAQGRPRFTTVGGFPRAYDPKKSSDFKNYVKLAAAQHVDKLLDGPIILDIAVYRSTLKSFSVKKAEKAEREEIVPTTKPDLDNYIKGIKDALKGVVWRDDSQVVNIIAKKRYSQQPRIEITVREVLPL